ncbi:MAG: ABC transporter permease, partial [Lachnospiraceae bacterium]|nr:ABC transporter permease [Lachnospiraceae bacterium]
MNSSFILITFLHNIIVYNIPLLYGTVGEIMVEKSGSLNLGVEGTMAVGAMFGYIAGCRANSFLVGLIVAFISGALCGLIFAVLTVTLQANQNITGLTLTTFGLGVFFFVGNGVKAVEWPVLQNFESMVRGFADIEIPGLSQIPGLGRILFSQNSMVYMGIIIAVLVWIYLRHTRVGLRTRAIGENPAAADSVGINIVRYKYLNIMVG